MPSQTLWDYKRYNPGLRIDHEALKHRPEFAEPISRVITLWPHIESATSAMLARVVGRDAFTIVMIHAFLQKEGGQRTVVEQAVRDKTTGEDFRIYKAIFKLLHASVQDRRTFAHWPCATSPEVPKLLAFVEPEELARWQAAIHSDTFIKADDIIERKFSPIDLKKVRVYRIQDAERSVIELGECLQYILRFGDYHWQRHMTPDIIGGSAHPAEPDRTRAWLLSQPRIQQALAE